MSRKEPFNKVLLEAIDDGLLSLGESGRRAVYFHLQSLCSIKREDIPDKIEVFVDGLRKIFGFGAEVIEKAIAKSLYKKLGLSYEEKKGYTLLDYVKDAAKNFEI